jgi:hypothetical protein
LSPLTVNVTTAIIFKLKAPRLANVNQVLRVPYETNLDYLEAQDWVTVQFNDGKNIYTSELLPDNTVKFVPKILERLCVSATLKGIVIDDSVIWVIQSVKPQFRYYFLLLDEIISLL